MKLTLKDHGETIDYTFTMSKDEMSKVEFSKDALNFILKLEASDSLANQLEILLEYFHAIEGTNRVSDLARYMKYLTEAHKYKGLQQQFHNFNPNPGAQQNFMTSAPNPVYATAYPSNPHLKRGNY